MTTYTISTICHPPYFKHLYRHLMSIKQALTGNESEIIVLASRLEPHHHEELDNILDRVGFSGVVKDYTADPLTIGAARNRILSLAKGDWVVFFDCDTEIDQSYFSSLENYFSKGIDQDVRAMGGGIGACSCSTYGRYEGYLDITALIGKINGIEKDFFASYIGTIFDNVVTSLDTQSLKNIFAAYDIMDMRYLQGFNQILRRDFYTNYGGFDNTYISAEDREVAAAVLSHGYRVIFLAQCIVLHNYDFTPGDIMKRKIMHGVWSAHFRKKYKSRPDIVMQYGFKRWARYFMGTFNAPKPFSDTLRGRVYFFLSFLGYFTGYLKAEIASFNAKG